MDSRGRGTWGLALLRRSKGSSAPPVTFTMPTVNPTFPGDFPESPGQGQGQGSAITMPLLPYSQGPRSFCPGVQLQISHRRGEKPAQGCERRSLSAPPWSPQCRPGRNSHPEPLTLLPREAAAPHRPLTVSPLLLPALDDASPGQQCAGPSGRPSRCG